MIRIRKIHDDTLPVDAKAIAQVQEILRSRFHLLTGKEISELPDKLRNPLKYKFRTVLFVADDIRGNVIGFAFMQHAPDLNFCYLDFISIKGKLSGRGYGGALYERVRDEALLLGAVGLFFECLPDDPKLSPDPAVRRANVQRLKFYERYGAYPIINTAYETPIRPGDDNPPYIVFDGLGRGRPLRAKAAREIVRAILTRKYGDLCPPGYIDMVVGSFREDPVPLREPRYVKKENVLLAPKVSIPMYERIVLVVNEKHFIHHVRERGYVESPVRINAILKGIRRDDLYYGIDPEGFPERHIAAVHDRGFMSYFKNVCEALEPGKSAYPYVFPLRNSTRPPKELSIRAGYYCIDTFTPINKNAYLAARRAVDCTLTAAKRLLEGFRLAYSLVRPPGHHAERRAFGGFCYFNSAAVAAQFLSSSGRVAVLDIDYHHGNGTQEIFYGRDDVLTLSIHGHPNFAYPYFSGFRDERGSGAGEGYNMNLPLPETVTGEKYREALAVVLKRVQRFKPKFLVLSFGLDTAKGDPTGTWGLAPEDFNINARAVGALRLPTLVVQEGGYYTGALGVNARSFFRGLWAAGHKK